MTVEAPTGPRRPGESIAKAAVLIAAVTVAARLFGFVRVIVFVRAVGPTCLGDAYSTANTVPNIVFDVVAGGALSSLVIPVLAGPVAAGDRRTVDRTVSALLTWMAIVLVPITVAGLAAAHLLMRALIGHGHPSCPTGSEVAVGARMLLVFMPQVLLYGVGVVLTGVVQAHRRFLGPAVGPLLSSVVVIAAYLSFAAVATHRDTSLSTLPLGHELLLSVGTTAGVVALVSPLLVPTRRTGLRLRPTVRFPPGVAVTVRRMAVSGALVLGSQQLATAVVLRLANSRGATGTVVLYNLSWTVFLVPWAVLAVPLATSAFPGMTAAWGSGDQSGYARTTATTTRVLLVVCAGAAAVMAAVAGPASRLAILGAPHGVAPVVLARGLVGFAPGLCGYGLVALLSRALYAQGDARTPAAAVVTGWLLALLADICLVAALPPGWTVAAIGIGTSLGMTVSGAWLLAALRRTAGPASLHGVGRAAAAAAVGALSAVAVGAAVAEGWHGSTGMATSAALTVGCAALAVVVHVGVAGGLDRATARLVLRQRLAGRD